MAADGPAGIAALARPDPHELQPLPQPVVAPTGDTLAAGMARAAQPSLEQKELASLQAQGLSSIGTGDWQRQAMIGGLGLAGQAGQYWIATQPTSAEIANKARLRELQSLERQGMLGLSPQEYYRYQRALMDPIRTQTRDVVRSGEATAAGQAGISRSAAGLVRGQREGYRQLRETGLKAGQMLVGADIKRAQAQRQEMGERIASKGAKEQERQNLKAQILGSTAKPIGQMAASYQATQMTPGIWEKMVTRYGVDEATDLAEMMKGMGPGQRSAFVTSIQNYIKTDA